MKNNLQFLLIFIISLLTITCSYSQVIAKEVEIVLTPQEYFDLLKRDNVSFNEETFFEEYTSNVTISEMMYEVDALMNKTESQVSAQAMQECGEGFFDGFEDGSFMPEWVDQMNLYTTSVINNDPIEGSYSLLNSGSSSHTNGLVRTFSGFQPEFISYWIKPVNQSGANSYFVLGDDNTQSNFGVSFSYYTPSGAIRFYNGTGLNIPANTGVWYHIELRNIDWVNMNFDIYIDDILIQADFDFRASSTEVTQAHLYNLTDVDAHYDSIAIGCLNQSIVPTITEWGIIILTLTMMTFGLIFIRNNEHSLTF